MNSFPTEVEKYLEKYGLKTWEILKSGNSLYNNIVVIPAIKEFENIKKLLNSLAENDPLYFNTTLFLFVINSISNSSEEIKNDNKNSIFFISSIINKEISNETKKIINSGINVALVDASSDGRELPEKEGGVGFARKIGMDLALTQFDYQNKNKKILICLDADCTVEKNYLTTICDSFNRRDLSAAAINYRHLFSLSDDTAPAIICYEIFLRYYQAGLKFAESPYAVHTIGSTTTCDYNSYIKVEGMNKRKAAEDFYFMEKLVKNVPVEKIRHTYVYPSARSSWRVPFGTGQRVNRFLSKVQDEYLLFDPETFIILQSWLTLFLHDNLTAEQYLKKAEKIDINLFNFLIQQKFENKFSGILSSAKNEEQLLRQKIKWFDAFKTLKLIHYLRDTSYPMINMFDALDKFFEITGVNKKIDRKNNEIPELRIQMEYLNFLRETDN